MGNEFEGMPKVGWTYSVHAHKNKNGIHYDVMLSPPGNFIAYKWSTKALPFRAKNIKAYRTKDRPGKDLDFEGEFYNKSGYNRKKLLAGGKAHIKSMGEREFTFNTGTQDFTLTNVRAKRYLMSVSDAKI